MQFGLLLLLVISPIFLFLRGRMSKKVNLTIKEFQAYTRNKILLITIFHFSVIFIICAFLSLLFLSIKYRSGTLTLNMNDLLYFSALIILCLITTYGGGSYISSVVLEQCMITPNDNHPKKLQALKLYNDYFHGPFSHVLMFSGTNAIALLISFFEINYPLTATNLINYGFYGVITGACVFIIVSKNKTWKHQIPWFLMFFLSHLFFIYLNKINFLNHPFNFFYLLAGITGNTALIFQYIFYRKKRKDYRYNLKFKFDQLFK